MKSLEFKISQLRQDKIIYATEAVAVNLACISTAFVIGNYVGPYVPVIFAVGALFTAYALLGNLLRLMTIKKLERQL